MSKVTLTFVILNDPTLPNMFLNWHSFVVCKVEDDFSFLPELQKQQKIADKIKGIALFFGYQENQVHLSSATDIVAAVSMGMLDKGSSSRQGGYNVVKTNGKIPRTRPGRKAPAMTQVEFAEKVKKSTGIELKLGVDIYADMRAYEQEVDEKAALGSFPFQCGTPAIALLSDAFAALVYNNKVTEDLSKINVDFENALMDQDPAYSKIMGLQTLPNGFTFLGGIIGGDWQLPVYAIIYHDGKSFRGYIPNHGNTYNPYNKSAFGDDPEVDRQFMKDNYPDSVPDDAMFPEDMQDIIRFDPDVLLKEIQTRLIVG